MEKIVIYTAITGGKDCLVHPRSVNENFDYVIFTDDPHIKSDLFRVIVVPPKKDANRLAKAFKVLPHRYFPGYDVSVWVDGCFQIVGDLEGIVKTVLQAHNIGFFRHYARNCLYKELAICSKLRKDDPKIMQSQVARYRKANFPEEQGLIMGGVIIRRHNKAEVKDAMEDWWREINAHSFRDQLSFNFIAWKRKLKLSYIEADRLSRYFKQHKHRKKR